MEKKLKKENVNENVTEIVNEEVVDEVKTDFIMGWPIKRKPYSTKGKQYFSYFVEGQARGQEWKAFVRAEDTAGYEQLESLFSYGNAMLALLPYKLTDERGRVTGVGHTFYVVSYDEEFNVYDSIKVIPLNPSDKSIINMLAARLNI